jgi:hypothetical protein
MRRADNLTTFMCRLSRNSGSLNLLDTCTGIAFLLPRRLLGGNKENDEKALAWIASHRTGVRTQDVWYIRQNCHPLDSNVIRRLQNVDKKDWVSSTAGNRN